MSKIILGLSGKIASGKGTASNYIEKKYNAISYRYSDPLKDTLEIFNLEPSRENLQILSTILRNNFSEDILAQAMLKRTKEAATDVVIIDGIRRLTDFANFQLLDNFYLIFIDVEQKTRFERYTKRGQSPGDTNMSWKEFETKDTAESEQQIESIKKKAHYHIDNNGAYEDFELQLNRVIKKIHEN